MEQTRVLDRAVAATLDSLDLMIEENRKLRAELRQARRENERLRVALPGDAASDTERGF